MQIEFMKIHGAGNDFVVLDNRQGLIELSEEQVRRVCDRHFGVGADGVIEVHASPRPQCAAYMHYRNADGSLAEMCGNGVRCFAYYLVNKGLLTAEEKRTRSFVVDTLAGPRPLTFEAGADGQLVKATVGMGEPALAPELIPTTLPPTRSIAVHDSASGTGRLEQAVVDAEIMNGGKRYVVTCVSMGNPHAVMFLEDVDACAAQALVEHPDSVDLDGPGAFLEGNTELFPQKTNAELAAVSGDNRISMRVYERGVGETLACGTGACAVAVASIIKGVARREDPLTIDLSGGTLEVVWLPDNRIELSGPAEEAFTGFFSLDRNKE